MGRKKETFEHRSIEENFYAISPFLQHGIVVAPGYLVVVVVVGSNCEWGKCPDPARKGMLPWKVFGCP